MAKISARNVTAQNVDDIMTTATYGGITYWAKAYQLSPAKIRQAVVEIAEGKHTNDRIRDYVRAAFDGWSAEDGIDCGEIDAEAADCIVQVACFGKVVYG